MDGEKNMEKERVKYNMGRLKVWQSRLSTYVGMVNFVMIFYLYIIESPMGLEWYHWAVIIASCIISIVFIDTKIIMPYALGYSFEKNPEWKKMKRNQKRIMDRLTIGESYE